MVDNSEQECLKIIKLKDHYEILNIPKTATEEEIRKAYKKLAIRFHPDKNKAKNAEEAFKKINQAFSILGNKEKKQRYDMFGTDDDGGMSAGHHENFDPFDIFNMFFNEMGHRDGHGNQRRGAGQAYTTYTNGNVSYTVFSSGGGFGGGFGGFPGFSGGFGGEDEGEEGEDLFSQLFNRGRSNQRNQQRSDRNGNSDNKFTSEQKANARKKRQEEMQRTVRRFTMCIQFLPIICCLIFFVFPIAIRMAI